MKNRKNEFTNDYDLQRKTGSSEPVFLVIIIIIYVVGGYPRNECLDRSPLLGNEKKKWFVGVCSRLPGIQFLSSGVVPCCDYIVTGEYADCE